MQINRTQTTLATMTLVGITAGFAGSAQAAVLDATADTFVRKGQPDSNYGSNTVVAVLNDGGNTSKGKDRLGVFRFDLSSQTGPFASASFTATGTSGTTDQTFSLYGIDNGQPDESFDESALKFNNFEYAVDDQDGSFDKNSTSLSQLATDVSDDSDGSTDDVFTFDTPGLLSFVNADTNDTASFILFRTTNNGNSTNFASSEASSGVAQLSLNVPEPASLALLGVGGVLMLGGRRRRQQSGV